MSEYARITSQLWIYFGLVSSMLFITYFVFFLDYIGVTFWLQDFFRVLEVGFYSAVVTLLFSCLYLQVILVAQTPIGREFRVTKQIRINPLRGSVTLLVCLMFAFIHATIFIVALLSNEVAPEFFSKFLNNQSYLQSAIYNLDEIKSSEALVPAEYFKRFFFDRATLVFELTDQFVLFVFYILFAALYCLPFVSGCVHIRHENLANYQEMRDICKKNGIFVDYDFVYKSSNLIFLTKFPKADERLLQSVLKQRFNDKPSLRPTKKNLSFPIVRFDSNRYTYRLRLSKDGVEQ